MIREPTAIISQLTNVRSVAEVSTHGVDGSFGGVQLFNKLVKTLGISAMQDESAGLGAERLSNGLTQSTGSSGDKYRTVSILHGHSSLIFEDSAVWWPILTRTSKPDFLPLGRK